MKKFFALFLALMCLAAPALAELPDLKQYTEEELLQLRDQINVELSTRQLAQGAADDVLCSATLGSYHVAVLDAVTMYDWKDNPCVVYTVRFTNNSDETLAFNTAIDTAAFQNGISCKAPVSIDGVNLTDYAWIEIRPGASYTVSFSVILYDVENVVELEMWDRGDDDWENGVLRFTWQPTE